MFILVFLPPLFPLQSCNGDMTQAMTVLYASIQQTKMAQGSEYTPTDSELSSERSDYVPSTGAGIVAQESGGMEVAARATGDGAAPANGPGTLTSEWSSDSWCSH